MPMNMASKTIRLNIHGAGVGMGWMIQSLKRMSQGKDLLIHLQLWQSIADSDLTGLAKLLFNYGDSPTESQLACIYVLRSP